MAPAAVSTCRDRTSEFRSLSERLLQRKKKVEENPVESDESAWKPLLPNSSPSEFNKKAARIGLGIHEASKKIARVANLAKRSSIFDDPIVEIQELTALIKRDITALNTSLSDLQAIQNREIDNGTCSEDRLVHLTAVCDDLKSRLMGATKQLQDVLTTRTENMKAYESRKQIFSTNAARENPFLHNPNPRPEPPPWARSPSVSGSSQQPALPSNGAQSGNQLRRRSAVDSAPNHDMGVSMLQLVVPRQENYTQSRAVALQNVESTITELSGVFTYLATMVAEQGELAIRIDDNVDESLANVEGASNALLKHLSKISSKRWLLIKIFAILIIFLLVFILFLA